MTSVQQREQHEDMKEHARESLRALIGEQVMNALGEPKNLYRLLVRPLWKDHYRVNILVGENAGATTIARSYFLQVDSDGNIVKASPKITKQY
jgi:hypothetical protein